MIGFLLAVSLTGTSKVEPGSAVQLPKSNTISPVGSGVTTLVVVVVTGLSPDVVVTSPPTVIVPLIALTEYVQAVLSLNTSALLPKPILYSPAGQLAGISYVSVNTVPPSLATTPSPSSSRHWKLRPGRARFFWIAALSRQVAVSPIPEIVIGES